MSMESSFETQFKVVLNLGRGSRGSLERRLGEAGCRKCKVAPPPLKLTQNTTFQTPKAKPHSFKLSNTN